MSPATAATSTGRARSAAPAHVPSAPTSAAGARQGSPTTGTGPVPAPGPLLLDATEAAAFVGVSRTTFYSLDSAGEIPRGVRLGRMRRWPRRELEEWVAAGCPARHVWEDRAR